MADPEPPVDVLPTEVPLSVSERVSEAVVSGVFSVPSLAVHMLCIVLWMTVAEPYPWGALITLLSIEAIFLTMFVGIGQKATDHRMRQHHRRTHDRLDKLVDHLERRA